MDKFGHIVMVSDVHLRHCNDARGKALIELVDSLDVEQTKVFCLLGDIFDFYLGSASYYDDKHTPLRQSLEKASARGIRVVLVEGNHEFRMREANWPGVELIDDLHITIRLKNVNVGFCHGDMINPPLGYRLFRRLVKSRFVTGVAAMLPQSFVESYVFSHSSVSKSTHKYRKMNHDALLDSAKEKGNELKADILLFGHYHTPYYVNDHNLQIVCNESWDKINCLNVFEDGSMNRAFKKNATWEFEELKLFPRSGNA